MNQTSIKVSLTLVAAAALLVVGWFSAVSMEQQQAHASACNAFIGPTGSVERTTGGHCIGFPNPNSADNQHLHMSK